MTTINRTGEDKEEAAWEGVIVKLLALRGAPRYYCYDNIYVYMYISLSLYLSIYMSIYISLSLYIYIYIYT